MPKNNLALVFLHYFGGSSREWNHLTTSLGGEFPCVALNLPGHGGRDNADGYERGLDALADDVAREIAQAGLTHYILVGHSMGGKVALALAARQSPELLGLFLLAPSPPTPEPMTDKDRTASLEAWGDPKASEESLQKIIGLPIPEEARKRFTEDNLRTTPEVWHWWYSAGSKEDISDRLLEVSIPIWVMSGSEDPIIPPSIQQRETTARLANSRLVRVPGAGHLLPDEAPETVEAALRQFITVLSD